MKKFDINTPVKRDGTYQIKVKDARYKTLKNGKKILSWSAMERLAAKI